MYLVSAEEPPSNKASCHDRWQSEIKCVLQEGQWAIGKTMNYTYYPSLVKPTAKDNWSICKHRVMPYVWKSNPKCTEAKLTPTYSQSEICSIVGGRNVMIVGDSISNEFFVTLAASAWLPSIPLVSTNIVHLDSFIRYDKHGNKIGT